MSMTSPTTAPSTTGSLSSMTSSTTAPTPSALPARQTLSLTLDVPSGSTLADESAVETALQGIVDDAMLDSEVRDVVITMTVRAQILVD